MHNALVLVQQLSHFQIFVTPWIAAGQASLFLTISWSLFKLMSTELVIPSNVLILCHPLLLLPSIFPIIRVFYNESVLWVTWQKYWSFSFSVSLSNEYSGLISFRIYWFDHLAVQGTSKSCRTSTESINSSVVSLFYCPPLTPIHDYCKNQSFYYTHFSQQSNVSAF